MYNYLMLLPTYQWFGSENSGEIYFVVPLHFLKENISIFSELFNQKCCQMFTALCIKNCMAFSVSKRYGSVGEN